MVTEISDELAKKRLDFFYKSAFLPLVKEADEGYNVYRVFLGKRCLSIACDYINNNKEKINPLILNKVYSENGFILVAKKLAEDFYNFLQGEKDASIKDFKHYVMIYHDIFKHGRTITALLSKAEDVFADTFISLSKNSVYTTEQLYNIFNKFIVIRNGLCKNSYKSFLRERYRTRIINEGEEGIKYDSPLWGKISYEIDKNIYNSNGVDVTLQPSILLNKNISRKDIREMFINNKEKNNSNEFNCLNNTYANRNIDTYICKIKNNNSISAVMTLRCNDNYLIPFLFLPTMNSVQHDFIVKKIDALFSSISPKYKGIILKKYEEWCINNQELKGVFEEFLTTLLNTILLRAFLDEIGYSTDNKEDFVRLHTTTDMLLCNFAYDNDVKKLLYAALDQNLPPVCSLTNLKSLLIELCSKSNSCILNDIWKITENSKSNIQDQKIIKKIEKVAFDYGISRESGSNSLLNGSLSPSEDSIQYLSFPVDNTISDFLKKVYSYRNSWVCSSLSVDDALSCLLQMIDYGCFSIKVGANEKNGPIEYIQCIKPEENSLNLIPLRYARSLPFLDCIEHRCKRQGYSNIFHLNDDLNWFFVAYKNYEKKHNVDLSYFNEFVSQKNELVYMMYKIISSGQSCDDYMFLVEEMLKNYSNVMPAEELIKNIQKVFYRAVI